MEKEALSTFWQNYKLDWVVESDWRKEYQKKFYTMAESCEMCHRVFCNQCASHFTELYKLVSTLLMKQDHEIKMLNIKLEELQRQRTVKAKSEPVNTLKQSERLMLEKLQTFHAKVLRDSECAICLETLASPVVLCVKGHVICAKCKGAITSCPVCRETFSRERATWYIQQVLEVLPRNCQYDPCREIFLPGDDHEQYCELRPTVCELCPWSGPCGELLGHIADEHSGTTIYTETDTSLHLSKFLTNRGYHSFLPVLAFDQFFWIEVTNNPEAEMLNLTFATVHCRKPDSVIFAFFELNSRDEQVSVKKPVRCKNRIIFHHSSVENCVKNSKLQFCLKLTQQVQSANENSRQ